MRIGFIGTGAIAEAIIVGLIEESGFSDQILVSKRSENRSEWLAKRFSNVSVVDDNQSIVTKSEMVFLATLPEHALAVFETLDFAADQTIVSLAAGISVEEICSVVKPAYQVHRIIPMPPNEFGVGPIPIYPPNDQLINLLAGIGTVIPVNDESQFTTFSASSALMATFFELVATNAKWIEAKGVSSENAVAYSTALFQSLATMTTKVSDDEVHELSDECLTAGGLNEQVLLANRKAGWFDFQANELNKILDRIKH